MAFGLNGALQDDPSRGRGFMFRLNKTESICVRTEIFSRHVGQCLQSLNMSLQSLNRSLQSLNINLQNLNISLQSLNIKSAKSYSIRVGTKKS